MDDFENLEFLGLAVEVSNHIGFSDEMIHPVRMALIEYQNDIDPTDLQATIVFIRDLFEPAGL